MIGGGLGDCDVVVLVRRDIQLIFLLRVVVGGGG